MRPIPSLGRRCACLAIVGMQHGAEDPKTRLLTREQRADLSGMPVAKYQILK
jgi:hypothetical protein